MLSYYFEATRTDPRMLHPLGHTDAPDRLLRIEHQRFADGAAERYSFCFTFDLERYWLDQGPTRLGVLCELTGGEEVTSRIALTDEALPVAALAQPATTFDEFCGRFELSALELPRPLLLETQTVAKPWGAEIWYTGIERRGVCRAEGVPLPWLLALGHPHLLQSVRRELILLKILAPHDREVEGDLYFETHREKVEVYVVTRVEPTAWPGGRGGIRLGFDPVKVAKYGGRREFDAAYLDAVGSYRKVRLKIDTELDRKRAAEGYAPDDVVPSAVNRAWLARLPRSMSHEEQSARQAMESFYALRELRVGDVVHVTPGTPHSLQHGVRVVEFQTPHYERLILSFGQKVLTQSHWDTAEAMSEISLEPPEPPVLKLLVDESGVRVDRAARFDAFEVLRVTLRAGAGYRCPVEEYAVAIGVSGHCRVAGREMESEQAYLISAANSPVAIRNESEEETICLVALPR